MRVNNTKRTVKTNTTEDRVKDMLGRAYLWISERTNRIRPQRPHRNTKHRYIGWFNEYSRGVFRAAVKGIRTAPTAYLRSLNGLINKGKGAVCSVTSKLRKQKRNGN